MKIGELVYSTVKIVAGPHDGTGFIMDFSLKHDEVELVIVTNKHVIEESDNITIGLTIQKPNRHSAIKKLTIANYKEKYIESDDYDLCAISLNATLEEHQTDIKDIVIPHITINDICDNEELLEFDAICDVIVVGYPNGVIDEDNNLPIVRKGINSTPLYSKYQSRNLFVVDAGVFEGNSGSPVYIKNVDGLFRLVGVVQEWDRHYTVAGFYDNGVKKDVYCLIPSGLGIAIQAQEVLKMWGKAKEKW